MKGKSIAKLLGVLVIIGFLTYTAIYGFYVNVGTDEDGHKQTMLIGAKGIKTGLDISGGVGITYEASKPNGNITKQEMDSALTTIRARLDAKNYNEATVTADTTKNWILVDIPSITNPEEAIQTLGKPANLEFKDPEGKVILGGKDIKTANAKYGQISQTGGNEWYIELTFTESGRLKFADATGRLVGKPIGIYFDNELKTNPTVQTKIDSPSAIISGNYTKERASAEADLIRSGALPFQLKVINSEYVGPSVGQQALTISIRAGLVAFIIVCLFMLIFYRLPGLVASMALLGYTVLIILILAILGINLTLPGIAGIILSIGMAVDANVIIFERLKEELRAGKTLKTSLDLGFKRAFKAIFDANMTTIISAVVLIIFGTGPIKGFAIVLLIGVLLSMFTALTLTDFMLKQVVDITSTKNQWLYGAKRVEEVK